MDIATLGVSVDPKQAQAGSKAVVAALTEMGDKGSTQIQKVETAVDEAGASLKKMATTAAAAGTQAEQSMTKVSRSPAFDQIKAKAASTGRAMQQAMTLSAGTTTSPWQRLVSQAQSAAQGVQGAFQRTMQAAQTTVSGAFQRMTTGVRMFGSDLSNAAVAGMGRIASTAQSVAGSVTGAFGRMRASVTAFKGSSASIVDVANTLGLLNNPLGNAISRFDSLRRVMGGIPALAGPIVGTLGVLAAAFAGIAAAVSLTWSSMSTAGPVQQAQLGLEAVTGSAKQATAVMEAMRATSKRTGADLEQSLGTGIKFIGLGFSPADAVKLNESIQDIAGTLGMSASQAGELGNALAQVKSKGVVAMEELRQQIAEKGVPVFDELAKKLKIGTAQLIKQVGEGKVQSMSLLEIFTNLEGGFQKFAGGAQRGAATLPGAISRITATWNDLLITMGKPINDAVAPFLNQLADRMAGLGNIGESLGNGIAGAITKVGPMLDSFIAGATGKLQGFLSMVNSSDGLGVSWARNIWITFTDYGLDAVSKVTAGFATFGQLLARYSVDFIEMIATVTTPEFWSAMGSALGSIAIDFENGLRKAAEAMINLIIDNAPPWLGGGGTRANFGRIANPTIPGKAVKAPDLYTDNNTPLNIGDMYTKNLAKTGSIFDPLRDQWKQYGKDKATASAAPWVAPRANGEALSKISTGGDPGKLPDSKAEKEAEKAFKKLQTLAKQYIEATRTPLEKYNETLKEVDMLTQKGLLTADQAGKARAKAAKDMQAAMESTGTPLSQLRAQWANLSGAMQQGSAQAAQAISGNIGNALMDMIDGTKSASQAFSDMGRAIVNDLARIATQMLVNYAIQKAIGFAVGAITGTPTTTATVSSGATSAAVHHTGGIIGQGSVSRTVDSGAFASAPRFQHGGRVPGLSSGETPVIAEAGETMLNRDQAVDIRRRLGTAKGKDQKAAQPMAVTVINVTDPTMLDSHMMRNPNSVLNVLGANSSKARRMLQISSQGGS